MNRVGLLSDFFIGEFIMVELKFTLDIFNNKFIVRKEFNLKKIPEIWIKFHRCRILTITLIVTFQHWI